MQPIDIHMESVGGTSMSEVDKSKQRLKNVFTN